MNKRADFPKYIKGDENIKFRSIGESIVHVIVDDKDALARCMMRMQEHYESPFEDIRGKIFTLGQLKAKGSREYKGINTYCGGIHHESDWSGYNFPDYVLKPFIKGLFEPLTSYEADMVEALRYRTDKFYVIGTYGDDDPGDALEHEIRHAMYYISQGYQEEVDLLLGEYSECLENFKHYLIHLGYAEAVLWDECQAYVGPDYDWIFKDKKDMVKKFKIKIPRELSKRLNVIADKYKPKLGIK